MSQSLYRKYRPHRFGELVGQAHVATALTNTLRDGRVGHAYLFSGPRGTGKTTTARILAAALNCLELETGGEPCGHCANCVAVSEGRFLDLFELDAASNNSVADIREVVEGVNLGVSTMGRKKVYLIDEVHMLSTAASNALLKTLEEPPDHVVFILATTNPEKVLPTIRSRTQHFEFALLDDDDLSRHLESILDLEKVGYEHEAVAAVARKGAGSARDALSALDQILAVSPEQIDTAALDLGFGSPIFDTVADYLAALLAGDVSGALVAIADLHHVGVDGRRIADESLGRLRDAYLITTVGDRVHVPASEHEAARLRTLAEISGPNELLRALDLLGAAAVDVRAGTTPDPRLALEVATVRIARPEAGLDLAALATRLERLERGQRNAPASPAASPTAPPPAPTAASPTAPSTASPAAPTASPERSPGATPTLGALRSARAQQQPALREVQAAPPAVPAAPGTARPLDLDEVIAQWPHILEKLEHAARVHLQHAQPVAIEEGDVVAFSVPHDRSDVVRRGFQQHAQHVREAFAHLLSATPRFRLSIEAAPVAAEGRGPLAAARRAAPGGMAEQDESSAHDERRVQEEPPVEEDEYASSEQDAYEALTSDVPAATPVDSVSKLLNAFDAEIVEEVPRG